MTDEITIDQLRVLAQRAGLKLSEEELQGLLPGVNRSRRQTAELRDILLESAEPAGIFIAAVRRGLENHGG
jgi:hypothetical protein